MLKPIAQSEIEKAAKDFGVSVEVAELVARATDRAIENTIVDLFKQAGVLLTEYDGEFVIEPWPLSESLSAQSDNPPQKA